MGVGINGLRQSGGDLIVSRVEPGTVTEGKLPFFRFIVDKLTRFMERRTFAYI